MTDSRLGAASAKVLPDERIVRRPPGWSRFLLIALALHIPLFVYPIVRLTLWLDVPWWLMWLVLIPLAGSQVISRVFLRHRRSRTARFLRLVADFWLGVSPIVLIFLLVAEILVGLSLLLPVEAATLVLLVSGGFGATGVVVAMLPFVKRIRFTSGKLQAPLRFVQITDVHIGSRSSAFLDRVVNKINELHPDFVCITGDFIDASDVPESDLASLARIVVPIYFCIGNHEKYEDLEQILARLRNLGVQVLRNDTTWFRDDVQVLGIDDMEDALQVRNQLQHLEIDADAFKLLLYHRPRGLEAAASAGIDLMISGHTHNGQIVPFNLVVGKVFDRVKGMYSQGESRLYVSQGTGTWGPVMRIGTRSEITLFELDPVLA